MNKNVMLFFAAAGIIFGLSSCNNDPSAEASSKDKLRVVTTMTKTEVANAEDLVVFTGDDIDTFNGKTGRIVFKELRFDDLFQRAESNSMLKFYLGDEFLFDIILLMYPISRPYDVPVLIGSRGDENVPDKFFLLNGYPLYGGVNPIAPSAAWNKFIRYLTDSGKLTEADDPVSPPAPITPNDTISAIRVDDIQSYNLSTGEIVFSGFTVQDIHDGSIVIRFGIANGFLMPFYLGEELLLKAMCVSPLSSISYQGLAFTWYEDKFYLQDGYPAGASESWIQTHQAEWDAFIQALNDAGKIV